MPIYKTDANFKEGKPRHEIHIGWYLTVPSLKQIVSYLHDVGLAGQGHQYTAPQNMHATIFYGLAYLPADVPKITELNPVVNTGRYKYPVRPSAWHNIMPNRTKISINIGKPADAQLREASLKWHKRLHVNPHLEKFIFHIEVSKVQLRGKMSSIQDYMKLPPYTGLIEFNSEVISFNSPFD